MSSPRCSIGWRRISDEARSPAGAHGPASRRCAARRSGSIASWAATNWRLICWARSRLAPLHACRLTGYRARRPCRRSSIPPEHAINARLSGGARAADVERGTPRRVDSTVVDRPIHAPVRWASWSSPSSSFVDGRVAEVELGQRPGIGQLCHAELVTPNHPAESGHEARPYAGTFSGCRFTFRSACASKTSDKGMAQARLCRFAVHT